MLNVVLATTNPAKAARLRRLCEALPFTLTDGSSLPSAPPVTEDGSSHLANAVQKAAAWSRALGAVALASDGGLVIPAVRDWQSVLTRRATDRPPDTPPPSDADRARWLLAMLHASAGLDRAAHWSEAVAIARNGRLVGAWEASGLHGAIALDYVPAPEGVAGFWVSGLWVSPAGKRLWQMTEADLTAATDPWHTLTAPVRDLLARMVPA